MSQATLIQEKLRLRQELREIIAGITPAQRKKKSLCIFEKLLGLKEFRQAPSVLLYMALPDEVDTDPILQYCLEQKKHVYLPRLRPKSLEMEVFEIRDPEADLERGKHGILEPKEISERIGKPDQLDYMLVPGVAFDPEGGRLGRGMGYFDRFLSRANRGFKAGLCFSEQLLPRVPMGRYDELMDVVICDRKAGEAA